MHILSTTLLRLRWLYWSLVYAGFRRTYAIHSTFRFNGAAISMYGDGAIELGPESYIGELSTIQASAGRAVRIGRRCRISHNVRIYTQTTSPDTDFRLAEGRAICGDVVVGDGVWLGVNVYVGPGVTIGDNSVVGANAVVTVDIPANEIWGGTPARHLRSKMVTDETLGVVDGCRMPSVAESERRHP